MHGKFQHCADQHLHMPTDNSQETRKSFVVHPHQLAMLTALGQNTALNAFHDQCHPQPAMVALSFSNICIFGTNSLKLSTPSITGLFNRLDNMTSTITRYALIFKSSAMGQSIQSKGVVLVTNAPPAEASSLISWNSSFFPPQLADKIVGLAICAIGAATGRIGETCPQPWRMLHLGRPLAQPTCPP